VKITFDQLFAQIDRRIEQGQLKTPLENLMAIATHSSTPQAVRAKAYYDIGVLFYKHIGDGEKARTHFIKASDLCTQIVSMTDWRIQVLHVFTLENLLLLSLSYEEFELLAEQIRTLNSDSATLSMISGIQERKAKGASWAEVMGFLGSYAFEQNDYPLMASVFHLMLAHRRTLRLPKQQWRYATRSYGEAIRYIVAVYGDRIQKERRISSIEILFLGEDALAVLNEYLNDNSSDDEVMEVKKDIEEMVHHLRRMK
jgi:hypothetical protein